MFKKGDFVKLKTDKSAFPSTFKVMKIHSDICKIEIYDGFNYILANEDDYELMSSANGNDEYIVRIPGTYVINNPNCTNSWGEYSVSYDNANHIAPFDSQAHECNSNLKQYTGFTENYKYCIVCDKKFFNS